MTAWCDAKKSHPTTVRPRPARLVAAVVAGGLVLAACANGGTDDRTAPTTTTSSTAGPSADSSTTHGDAKAEILAALEAYWAMDQRLLAAPDPDDPEIAQRAVDPSLSAIRDDLRTKRAQGQRARFDGVPWHHTLAVGEVRGDRATWTDCFVDGGVLVGPDGEVVNDEVNTYLLEGTAVFVAGVWKVQRFDVAKKAPREVSCDELA